MLGHAAVNGRYNKQRCNTNNTSYRGEQRRNEVKAMISSRIERARRKSRLHRDRTPEAPRLLAGQEHILELISLGASLSVTLNTLCASIDFQLGGMVSLVLLSDEENDDLSAIVHNAGDFGLHTFCSVDILSDSYDLLGTLEMLCCDPRTPTTNEWQLIECAKLLACIAIQSWNGGERCGPLFNGKDNDPIRRAPCSAFLMN